MIEAVHRLSEERLREILAATEGVTPGPWGCSAGDDYYISASSYPSAFPHRFKGDDLGGMLAEVGNRPADFGEANAIHIANCDPQTIAALVTEVLAAREELDRLRTALLRIAFKDRHYRVLKPKADGGFRGVGGMIATYALTGVNGSYIGDAKIAEQYPELSASIRNPTPPALKETTDAA